MRSPSSRACSDTAASAPGSASALSSAAASGTVRRLVQVERRVELRRRLRALRRPSLRCAGPLPQGCIRAQLPRAADAQGPRLALRVERVGEHRLASRGGRQPGAGQRQAGRRLRIELHVPDPAAIPALLPAEQSFRAKADVLETEGGSERRRPARPRRRSRRARAARACGRQPIASQSIEQRLRTTSTALPPIVAFDP